MVAAVALVLTSGHRLAQIVANTPQDTWLSYGAMPLLAALGFDPRSAVMRSLPFLLASALSLGALFAGWIYRDSLERLLPRFNLERPRGCIAVAGLAIFCFTFLRGSSYCYRLMFLVGVLGLLVEDLERGKSLRSLWLALGLLAFLWATPNHALTYQLYCALIYVVSCAWLGTGLVIEMEALGQGRLHQVMQVRSAA